MHVYVCREEAASYRVMVHFSNAPEQLGLDQAGLSQEPEAQSWPASGWQWSLPLSGMPSNRKLESEM